MTRPPPSFPIAEVDELVTIRDLLRYTVSAMTRQGTFFGHGFPDAMTEAAYLLGWGLDLPPGSVHDFLDARVTAAEREHLVEMLRRRIDDRVPAPYITREAWLGEHRFYVDERALVPRSFLADLLANSLSPWIPSPEEIGTVLDLCTGSGCLAVLAAFAFPNARVDAVDISPDALAVAERNVAEYGLEDRVHPLHSDLFAELGGRTYDVILCNPPYVDDAAMRSLPDEYRREPALALAGGQDGLDTIRRLLAEAANHLHADGVLVTEVGHDRPALERAYPETPFTWLSTHAGDDFVFLLAREQLPGRSR